MAKRNPTAQSPSPKNQSSVSKASRLDELNDLSDAELKERYVATFAAEPDEQMSRDAMVASINDAAPKPPPPQIDADALIEEGGKVYGNKDKARQYPIKKDWKDKVVVRQVKVETLNGGMVEVPNTADIQTYDKDYYQHLIDINFFGDSKLKVDVLHQPK